MFVFRKTWRALFSWNTLSEIRPFALLPTKWNIGTKYVKTNAKSSHRRYSVRKDVLRNFAKFTGKHLCLNLQLYWKQTLAQVFSFKFYEISKSTFFVEQIQKIASAMLLSYRNQSVDLQSKWSDLFLYDWKASLNILFPNILIDCITEK